MMNMLPTFENLSFSHLTSLSHSLNPFSPLNLLKRRETANRKQLLMHIFFVKKDITITINAHRTRLLCASLSLSLSLSFVLPTQSVTRSINYSVSLSPTFYSSFSSSSQPSLQLRRNFGSLVSNVRFNPLK